MKYLFIRILTAILAINALSFSTHFANAVPEKEAPIASYASVQEEQEDSTYTIAMVGDMMVGTTFPVPKLPRNNGENLFDDVRKLLIEADVAAGNLEGTICDEEYECAKDSGEYVYAFRMQPSYVGLFEKAGFDFLSIANNHSHDFGMSGIRRTMELLDSVGIACAGVKRLCEKAVVERNGVKYGFCAFGHNWYCCNHKSEKEVQRILRSLRAEVDILIVSFHGGAEGKDQIHLPEDTEMYLGEDRGSLRKFAHLCIDEGADVVFGHGPHVCRAVEVYNGHFIAYSLGNFCTPMGINITGIMGHSPVIVVEVGRDGKLKKGKIHSYIQVRGKGPKIDFENRVAHAIQALTEEDFENPHLVFEEDGTFSPR